MAAFSGTLWQVNRRLHLPGLAAAGTLVLGLINLASALTPNQVPRNDLLQALEPLEVAAIAHALAVPAAAALLVCAPYLQRRRRGACYLACALLLLLGVLNLVKGLDGEETLACVALAAFLWWRRDAFAVAHDPVSLRSAVWRIPALVVGTVLLAFVSVWLAARWASFGLLARETGDLLLWSKGPIRFRDEFGRLPLAIELLTLGSLASAAYLVLRPLAAPRALPDWRVRRIAERLVREHGRDTLAFFKLRRDQQYVFEPGGRAFVGFRIDNGVMLCSGEPVGPPEAVPDAIAEAAAFAERHGLRLAALGVRESLLPLYLGAGLHALYVGDEAIVETKRFSLEGRPIRKVRQSVARLERERYTTELAELGSLDEPTLTELERVAERWRAGAPERGFSMAMDSLRNEHQGDSVVVLGRDADGAIAGFLHFVPVCGTAAVSLSAMRRERSAPNGLSEFLVVRAIEGLRERGIEEVSLNFAAFARLLHSPRTRSERLLGRAVTLANPYFQIESLYRFNAKFFPRWEPRYLVYDRLLALPRIGLATMWIEGQLRKPFARAS